MNDFLRYFVKSLAITTLTLKKKGILTEKPWSLIDNNGEIQKLIFKKDKGLILSKNGKVIEGSWDYYPEARALLINRGTDKLLLNEQYIDENVLILKKDGTDNDFFALANENTIPDYNISKYLNSLKCKEFKIEERKLLNGNVVHIHNATKIKYLNEYFGHNIEQIDSSFSAINLQDGHYLTDNKELTFYIKDGKISSVKRNLVKQLKNGESIEIENGNTENFYLNINKRVTINGNSIPDSRLYDNRNRIIEIKESKIVQILTNVIYVLKDGSKIKVEQKDYSKIMSGDRIIESSLFPIPDGFYKIKGKLRKIKVKDCFII